MPRAIRSFTYGAQFEPQVYDLPKIIELALAHAPNRAALEAALSAYQTDKGKFPNASPENRKKLAMNTFLSLNSYGLVQKSTDGSEYEVTELSKKLLDLYNGAGSEAAGRQAVLRDFATHILRNLDGMQMLKAIEAIEARDEQPELELIAEELTGMGLAVAPNSVKMSTMRNWLAQANVFRSSGFEINWDEVYDLLGITKDLIDKLYQLDSAQKHYLLAMIACDAIDFVPSNQIARYTRSVFKVRLTSKNLINAVLNVLEAKGLIQHQKTTIGRGAKPGLVKLTDKVQQELVQPLLSRIAEDTELPSSELNRTFESVVGDLSSEDKHVAGKALELLAIWMIRLTSLRFTKWRKRDIETGKGEVDVLAASDRLVYSRWQIQCKNSPRKPTDVDVVAKEIGMTFVTGADVVMLVTTGRFTSSAVAYAYRMMDVSRYYVILIEKEDIDKIIADRTAIIDILDRKAQRVFLKKELHYTDTEADQALTTQGEGEILDLFDEEDIEELAQAEPLLDAAIPQSILPEAGMVPPRRGRPGGSEG